MAAFLFWRGKKWSWKKRSSTPNNNSCLSPMCCLRYQNINKWLKIISEINQIILSNLTNSSKRSLFVKERYEASAKFSHYLADRYNLGNTYICGDNFLKDHSFQLNRYFNERNYTTIFIDEHNVSSFKFKLAKPRRKSFHINSKMEKATFIGKHTIHIRFTRDNRVI